MIKTWFYATKNICVPKSAYKYIKPDFFRLYNQDLSYIIKEHEI